MRERYNLACSRFFNSNFNLSINSEDKQGCQNSYQFLFRYKVKKLVFSVLVLLVLVCQGIAHQGFIGNSYTSQAVAPGGENALTAIESISLATGNLNIAVPLLNIGGRGTAGYAMVLPINYQWQIRDIYHPDGNGENWTHHYIPVHDWEGFNPTRFSPGKMRMQRGSTVQGNCQSTPATAVFGDVLSRIIFIGADGSQLEFYDERSKGQPVHFETPHCSQLPAAANRGNIWLANGSNITFIGDGDFIERVAPADDLVVYPSGFLNFPDGTKYRIESGTVSYIIDRNGNKVTFEYQFDTLTKITDSLGRETLISGNQITYKGFNDTDRIIEIGSDNLYNLLRADQTPKSTLELFPSLAPDVHSNDFRNPERVSYIKSPDGKQYKFRYNSYGEVARIEFPTGIAVEYEWDGAVGVPFIRRWVTERRLYETGGSGANYQFKTKYESIDFNTSNGHKKVTQLAPTVNGDATFAVSKHFFTPIPLNSSPLSWSDPSKGYEYKTEIYNADGTTLKTKIFNESEFRVIYPFNRIDYRPVRSTAITIENDKALAVLKKTEYDDNGHSDPLYFSHLNIKRTKAYNYKVLELNTALNGSVETITALFSEGDLVSVSETNYLYDAGYKERHIFGLPSKVKMLNPTDLTDVLAEGQFLYDEQNQYYSMDDVGTTVGYEAPTGNFAHLRGNITTARTWKKDSNTWIEIHNQFDNFGNILKVWDSSGDTTRFVETEYSSQYYYAYPTKRIFPAPDPTRTRGTDETSSVSTTYDFWTGRPLTVTDATGQITSIEYDYLLRPKKVTPPAGGAISENEYGDTPGNFYVKARTQVDSNNWAESTAFMDNLGRVYKTQTKDLQGDIYTEVQFDNFGRVKQVSNPYRQGEQIFWSKPRYDNQNRVVETYAPAPDGQTGASLGVVGFGISTIPGFIGNYIEATDASGRKARSLTNVFGNIVRVDEPTGNDFELGPLDNPNQASYYTYNIKGELVKIQQGQQNRYFMYDNSGRLIRVKQPEQIPNPNLATTGNPDNNQWTMGYTYDIFGNVTTVTDAKNTVITNEYDKAGRITKTTYTDGTPQIDYYYDGTGLGLSQLPQFAKGSLTKVSNGVSEARYTSFDNYGRTLASQQITDGQTYAFEYKYDGVGNLSEITYPSLRVVKTHLDSDGGLSAVSSKTAVSPYKTYASNFDYLATGSVKAMMLGNGRWETANFNIRQQLEEIGLGTSKTDTSLWRVNYEYGELNEDGSVDANKNIGSIAKQTIALPTTTFVQTYKYDALNRLKQARETTGSVTGAENWIQSFDYDRYGNRTQFYQKVGSVVSPINNITLPEVEPTTNRFKTTQGYIYDFNGNLIQDAENRGFTYNGDDKQTVVRDLTIPTTLENPDANVIGRYYYDGEGKRVKKITNTETTIFVYDAGGALAAEYSTQTPQNPTTSYLTTDHLGSPRVITDKQGNVISRRDFMPFGEEIFAGVGGRDAVNQKYSSSGIDNIRQRFTGYEKDVETELDFAEARMYQNKHGRFTAADPLLSSTSLSNPQTFNRYVYVGNNPINITDPLGLKWCEKDGNFIVRAKCNSDETDAHGRVVEVTKVGEEFAEGGAKKGDIIQLNSENDSLRILVSGQTQAAQIAEETGATVQAETDPVATNGAVPTPSITPQSLGAIPPCTSALCGSSNNLYTPPLDTSNNEPLKTVDALDEITDKASALPIVGTPFAVLNTIIKLGRGDLRGAGGNLVGAIPFGRALQFFRRANKVGDASKLAPCLLCFVAGTQVQTIDGLKPIEEIKIGDQVLSYNEQTKQNEYQVVYYTFRRFADDIYSIKIENEEKPLEVTSEHPFYIKIHQARDNLSTDDDEGEWEEVRDLEVGDEIRLVSGGWAKILDIRFKGEGEVFNFSVANNNNYYVGNSRLLTHNTNKNCPNNTPQGPISSYIDSTIGNSVRNTDTDASPLSIARTLKQNGFTLNRSADRKALIFTKGSVNYVLRTNSRSRGLPTLHRQVGKTVTGKIRLN